MSDNIKINAFDAETMQYVGEFESISKAANKLFIKCGRPKIWHHLNKGGYKNGIKRATPLGNVLNLKRCKHSKIKKDLKIL